MLWWLSVAPLGKPVVPLVYWMLIGSSNCRPEERLRSASGSVPSASAGRASPSGESRKPTRPGPGGRGEEDAALEPRGVAADLVDHRDVVRRLERLRADEQPAAGLLEHVG